MINLLVKEIINHPILTNNDKIEVLNELCLRKSVKIYNINSIGVKIGDESKTNSTKKEVIMLSSSDDDDNTKNEVTVLSSSDDEVVVLKRKRELDNIDQPPPKKIAIVLKNIPLDAWLNILEISKDPKIYDSLLRVDSSHYKDLKEHLSIPQIFDKHPNPKKNKPKENKAQITTKKKGAHDRYAPYALAMIEQMGEDNGTFYDHREVLQQRVEEDDGEDEDVVDELDEFDRVSKFFNDKLLALESLNLETVTQKEVSPEEIRKFIDKFTGIHVIVGDDEGDYDGETYILSKFLENKFSTIKDAEYDEDDDRETLEIRAKLIRELRELCLKRSNTEYMSEENLQLDRQIEMLQEKGFHKLRMPSHSLQEIIDFYPSDNMKK